MATEMPLRKKCSVAVKLLLLYVKSTWGLVKRTMADNSLCRKFKKLANILKCLKFIYTKKAM